jgi:hypothetical protein
MNAIVTTFQSLAKTNFMKIELSKEVSVANGMGSDPIGQERIIWWVRAESAVSEPFQREGDARDYYNGMIELYKKYGSFKPPVEIIDYATI